MPISLWGGREPKPGERWDYFGYGPAVTGLPPRQQAIQDATDRWMWPLIGSLAASIIGVLVVVLAVVDHHDVRIAPGAILIVVGLVPTVLMFRAIRAAGRSFPH